MAGHPWILNSWAFNVVIAQAYRIAALPGVALVSSIAVAGILWLVLLLAKRAGAHPGVAAAVVVCSLPLVTLFLTARPQLADYAGVLLLFLLLGRLTRGASAPLMTVVAVGLLVVVWTNLHAATPLVLGMLGATAVLALAWPPARSRAGWLLAALAVGSVSVLANPYGVGAYTQAFRVAGAVSSTIVEWRHLDPTDPRQLLSVSAALIALGVAVRRRHVAATATLAVTYAGAFDALRMQPVALLLALPVLASAATAPEVLAYGRSRRVLLTRAACVGVLAMTVLGAVAATHLGRPDPRHFSPTVVQAIPAHCRLFNSDLLGSYVILERPDVPVSFDTRSDLYGARRVEQNLRALAGHDRSALRGAGCVLVPRRRPWLRSCGAARICCGVQETSQPACSNVSRADLDRRR